ncbi:MAG TPA: universal stress protein [Nitrosopumilaceae archaeon]|nr:universal stress protein [Nitrosopumilaceae archaeon]
MALSSNPFIKILVPIDGSKNADKALSEALAICEKFGSKLILIHVISDFILDYSTTAEGFQIPNTTVIKIRKETREHAQKMMKERLLKAQEKKINCKSIIIIGDSGSEIINYAKNEDVNLIVMGARGLGKIKQLLLGSVSNKVVIGSPCPVLIVK